MRPGNSHGTVGRSNSSQYCSLKFMSQLEIGNWLELPWQQRADGSLFQQPQPNKARSCIIEHNISLYLTASAVTFPSQAPSIHRPLSPHQYIPIQT
mmetsp:Transcript_14686/g.31635  ORF Transcript_14686/g.31635 Transcript_14686/m.31635 type:complete len:96 (+) Transcript_14686:2325-2612(+)